MARFTGGDGLPIPPPPLLHTITVIVTIQKPPFYVSVYTAQIYTSVVFIL